MNSEETATSESTEASPLDESQQREQSLEGTDWRAESTRQSQRAKKAEDLNRQAWPYVQTAMALQKAPGGNAIIEKLQKGEPLTATQEKKLDKAKEEAGTTGMSEEQVGKMLETASQNFEQRLYESRKAEKAMDSLNEWARTAKTKSGTLKYSGYDELSTSPEWNEHLGTILDAIQKGTLNVPDDWSDPYKYAVHQNYGWLKALNPDIGKEKPTKKTEKDRRAAISQSTVQAGGVAPEDSDELPDWANPAVASRGVAGGGRSFNSLKRS